MDKQDPPLKHFKPLTRDVLAVKAALSHRFKLPPNVLDMMVDTAEYWPHVSTIRTGGVMRVKGRNPGAETGVQDNSETMENQFLLRSYPLGYIPQDNNATKCSFADHNTFNTLYPKPWSAPESLSVDATEEAVAWIMKNSQTQQKFPCRKIVFTIRSHDQGWGGDYITHKGTYKGSYTWFEVGQERLTAFKDAFLTSSPREPSTANKMVFHSVDETQWSNLKTLPPFPLFTFPSGICSGSNSNKALCSLYTLLPPIEIGSAAHEPSHTDTWFCHPLLPSNNHLQKNLTATRETQENIIIWRYDDDMDPESIDAKKLDDKGRGTASKTGEYVRGLKIGDTVTVWAKARFPSWVNTVEEVRIDVYWAV